MKPFVIDRTTWHYKFNKNFLNPSGNYMRYWEEEHNTFCSYWVSTVMRMIAASIIASGMLFILGVVLYTLWTDPLLLLGSVIAMLVIIGIPIGFLWLYGTWREQSRLRDYERKFDPQPESLFAQKMRQRKEKICPYVEYKN